MKRYCGMSLPVWFLLVGGLALVLGYALGELAGTALLSEELQQLRSQKASATSSPQHYRMSDEEGRVYEVRIEPRGRATMTLVEGEQVGSLAGLPAGRAPNGNIGSR